MVIENPMQVINVSAVPLCCGGAVCATNAENCGESAITIRLQKNTNTKNNGSAIAVEKNYNTQQHPEQNKAHHATFALPIR